MTTVVTASHYSPLEESINVASHGLGFGLSLAGLVALLIRATMGQDVPEILEVVSFGIFGGSLVVAYGASTLYHGTKSALRRRRLRVLDHASIYILIAGTYTPFSLITLQGAVGWTLFGFTWSIATAGVSLKLFFTGHLEWLSTLMYVLMGWLILFAINPLVENLAPMGLRWLVAGGISYTLGAVFYGIRKIPMNHAIFHIFTLFGSICHFLAVFLYVI